MSSSGCDVLRGGGVLLVDKPSGPTSHDVVLGVRRTLGERRVGHTGTLDPFASGLLVLCVGAATRLSQYLSGLDKEYLATVRLGQSTATHDSETPVEEEREGWRQLDPARLEEALASFRGRILQRPPRYSAKKVMGEPAHRRARRGEHLRLEAVPVTVHELEVLMLDPPRLELRLSCSSGTYVRALARDLGDALGLGAHLTALRRTRVGRLVVEDAVPPDQLGDAPLLLSRMLEPVAALAHMPSLAVGPEEAQRLAHGQAIPVPPDLTSEDETALAVREGALVAVVTREGGILRPRKVFGGGEG